MQVVLKIVKNQKPNGFYSIFEKRNIKVDNINTKINNINKGNIILDSNYNNNMNNQYDENNIFACCNG